MVYWLQSKNQLHKILKIPRLRHQDNDCRSLNFQFFSFEF
jgi:hypothetical protein